MRFVCIVAFAILCISPASAQSIEERRAACEAGDQVACAVVRAFENARDRVLSDDPETETTEANAQPTAAPQPASSGGLVWWQRLLIACGILYLLSAFVRGFQRAKKENEGSDVWSGAQLPLPKYLPGERNAQGDLIKETDRQRQIVKWDTSHVMKWLDEQRDAIRADVTETDVLEFETYISSGQPVPEKLRTDLREKMMRMMQEADGDEAVLWKNIDARYHMLNRARFGDTGGAYFIANETYFHNSFELSNALVFSLWRLDADRDFNPAAVNMWSLISENGIYKNDFVDMQTCEVYLRHFFNLGAPDGHFHIASQLLNFYVASPYLREDEGYVAAAMERTRTVDSVSFNEWVRFMKRNNLTFDLEDKSVSRDGLMRELQKQKVGTIQ